MNIPQITRERLASSVVGTPSMDTSGQAIGNAVAEGGNEIAQVAMGQAVKQQEAKIAIEYHTLEAQHKTNLIKATEDLKVTYASNPGDAVAALIKYDQASTQSVMAQTKNIRVKAALSQGAPDLLVSQIEHMSQWKVKQEHENRIQGTLDYMNDTSKDVAAIGADRTLSAEGMITASAPHWSRLAEEVGKYKYSLDSAMANEIKRKGGQNIIRSIFDAALDEQPQKAQELINSSVAKEYFNTEELKPLSKLADSSVAEFPKKLLARDIQRDLKDNTATSQRIYSGDMSVQELYNLKLKGDLVMRPETYQYASDIIVGKMGKVAEDERDNIKASIIAAASKLGMKLSNDPTKLTGWGSVGKERVAVASNTVKALYELDNKVMAAVAVGAMTPEEGKKYHDWMYIPMVNKVMQKTDPTFFEKLVSDTSNPLSSSLARTGGAAVPGLAAVPGAQAIFSNLLPHKVDEFLTASRVIDDHMKRMDETKSYASKIKYVEAYFKAASDKLGSINPRTSQPYTVKDIARSVTDGDIGSIVTNGKGESAEIIGYNGKGIPILKLKK